MSDPRLTIVPLMTVEEAAAWTTAEEQQRAAHFGSVERRREYLSWRAVVRQELGREVEIDYNAHGAPILVGRTEHLSVAHGAGRVAVLIADRPCGIDIERWGRNFDRVADRILSEEERQLGGDDPHFTAIAWCAKEALYKVAGERGISLRDELHLRTYAADHLTAQIKDGEVITLSVLREEEFLLVSLVLD